MHEEVLVEEYKAAEASIAHREGLIWTIGSILNASVMVLAGFIIGGQHPELIWVAAVISVVFSVIRLGFEVRYRRINLQKFRRLWEIEEEMGMRQNLYVRQYDKGSRSLVRAHGLIWAASIAIPVTLLIAAILAYSGSVGAATGGA